MPQKTTTNDQSSRRSWHFFLRICLVVAMLAAVTALSCNQQEEETSLPEDEVHFNLPATPEHPPDAGASTPPEGVSGIPPHQHEPQHGGVVRSVDVYHVEVSQNPVEIWLYDRRGHPLPLDDVEGLLVIYAEGKRQPYPLRVEDRHLSPEEQVTLPDSGMAFVELTVGRQSIDAAFNLPLGSDLEPAVEQNQSTG